ncbi:MAG: hypothetical protein V3U92_09805 [Cellulophaga sp.]
MKLFFYILAILIPSILSAQTPASDELVQIHTIANITAMNAISNPVEGSLIYNLNDKVIYRRTDTEWLSLEKKVTLVLNSDGSYTFSNGIDSDIILTVGGTSTPVHFISGVSPNTCLETGKTYDVIITGDNFDGSCTVSMSHQTLNYANVINTTQIQANITMSSVSNTNITVTKGANVVTHNNALSGTTITTHTLSASDFTLTNASYSGNILKSTSYSGWRGHAYNLLKKINNQSKGFLEFTYSKGANNNIYQIVGLEKSPSTNDIWMSYGFYLINTNNIRIYEDNSLKKSLGAIADGNVLKIEVGCDNVVKYYKNNTLVYTSAKLRNTDLYLDTSLYYITYGNTTNYKIGN